MRIGLDRSPEHRLIRARDLASHWDAFGDGLAGEDRETVAYARYLRDLRALPGGPAQDRYQHARPTLTAVHFLAGGFPEMRPLPEALSERLPDPAGRRGLPLVSGTDSMRLAEQKDRAIIKAMAIAGADPKDIAESLALPTEVVTLYERLGWDVRQRSSSKLWVHNWCIHRPICNETDPNDFERLCLVVAYNFGLSGLDRFLHVSFTKDSLDASDMDVIVGLTDRVRFGVLTLRDSTKALPQTIETKAAMMKAAADFKLRLRELQLKEQAAGAGDAEQNPMHAFAKALLECVTSAGFSSLPFDQLQQAFPAEERNCHAEYEQALKVVAAESAEALEKAVP